MIVVVVCIICTYLVCNQMGDLERQLRDTQIRIGRQAYIIKELKKKIERCPHVDRLWHHTNEDI